MRLTTFILIIALAQVSAKGFGQKITLNTNHTPIEKVLQSIRDQSGYRIFYDADDLKNQHVTLNINNLSVEEAIKATIKGLPLNYKIVKNSIVLSKEEPSFLERFFRDDDDGKLADIRGVVRNERGEALEGITVMVKGAKTGTRTNEKGEFLLKNVKKGDVLVFTGVAIEPFEYTVKDEKNIDLNLKARLVQLEEVNVEYNTGYQKIPKERATGSFVFIDSSIINRSVDPNIINRLEGLVPGLLFDKRDPNNIKLQIRGLYTLSETAGVSQPLIVVDNFPYEGNLNDLNPNDVENITILRDAAAASIWGARAGNGVIVITTKKGKLNRPISISLTASTQFVEKPDLFGPKLIPTSEFIDLEKFLFDKGFYDADLSDPIASPVTPVVDILNKHRQGLISLEEQKAQLDALRGIDNRKDFMKYLYQNQVNQQYAVNISGGNKIMASYLSIGYNKNQSELAGNNSSRISIRSDHTFEPIKKLKIQIGLNYTNGKENANSPGDWISYKIGNRLLPLYVQLADESGNPNAIDRNYKREYTDTVGDRRLLDWKYRPLQELKNNDKTTKSQAFLGSLGVTYKLTSFLDAQLNYQYQKTNGINRDLQNLQSYSTRDAINNFTNLGAVEQSQRYPIPMGDILKTLDNKVESNGLRGQFNFNLDLNNVHHFSSLAGAEIRQVNQTSNSNLYYGFNRFLSVSNVDYINYYPRIFGGSSTIWNGVGFSDATDRYVSYFLNGSYNYKNTYTLTASARKDASNIFGVRTNEKGRPFWSVGVSWNLAKENFYKSKIIPDLSLRATYGYSGNIDPSVTALTIVRYSPASINPLTNRGFAELITPPNPNLRWEKVRTFNIGLDFSSKSQRISGSLEYYTKRSTDVITGQTLDPTVGQNELRANSAEMEGNGIDLNIQTKIFQNVAISWNTVLSLSYASYKISKSLYLKPTTSSAFLGDGMAISPYFVGYNPYEVISLKWGALDPLNGNPRGILNGKISGNADSIFRYTQISDLVFHGSNVPTYFGNLMNHFNWKGIALSFNIVYRLGYYFRKPEVRYSSLINSFISQSDYLKRWQKPGDEKVTDIPSIIYPMNDTRDGIYNTSAAAIEKGDNIKLNDIRIDYNLKNIINRLPFKGINVYANASNLNLMLWKANKANLDPDFVFGLKPPRAIVFGFNIIL